MRTKSVNLPALLARIRSKGCDTSLSQAEAVALVAARLLSGEGGSRVVRNAVSMAMKRATETGRPVIAGGLPRDARGRMTVDDVARWAMSYYCPGPFLDLPLVRGRRFVDTLAEHVVGAANVEDERTTGRLDEAQREIAELRALVRALQSKIDAFPAQLRQQLAERFGKRCTQPPLSLGAGLACTNNAVSVRANPGAA